MKKGKKKFFRKKNIVGNINDNFSVFVVSIPPALWDNWVDMLSDMNIEDPAALMEIHMDNYLRRKRKVIMNLPKRQFTQLEIAVYNPLIPVLNNIASTVNKTPHDFIITYMRRLIQDHSLARVKYFDALEKYENETDITKKKALARKINTYKLRHNNE
jgi:hypothetical protein